MFGLIKIFFIGLLTGLVDGYMDVYPEVTKMYDSTLS